MQFRMAKFFFINMIFLVLLIGCSLQEPIPDDDEILAIAYSSYKIPDDFYREDLDGGSIYYDNSLSILPLNERISSSFQLCTDDLDQAREWSEATSQNSSYYRKRVEESETEKYFQFRRVYEQNPTDIILSRVHKQSYLDRSMYDFFNPGTILGQYNKKPYNLEEVQELIEYLWFTDYYALGGRKVLDSSISVDRLHFICMLNEIQIVYGDWGIRDEITVLESTYFINKTDGKITYSQEVLKTIQGKMR